MKILGTLAWILGTLVLMVISGIVTFVVAIIIVFGFRQFPPADVSLDWVFFVAAIGFFAPGVVVWSKKSGR